MRRLLLLSLTACLLAGGRPQAAAPLSLKNGRIAAQFGDRGLVSLTDASLSQTHRFASDDFALTIGGQDFDSRTLAAPARTDRWEAQLRIDGRPVELRKAYGAVRAASRTFVGFYADVSLLAADVPHSLELQLPPLKPGQFQGVFFENVETEYTDRLR